VTPPKALSGEPFDSEASTQVSTSAKKNKPGISIAPPRYKALSDVELERVIRNEIAKNPHLIKRKLTFY
jgi:hypothetical protein